MILAAHQPNFMPYMGYFYKMYLCDVFAFSDTVQFSRSNYQNYNYFDFDGVSKKITVPVSDHVGPIKDVRLSDWDYNRKKIWKRLCGFYSKAPYFKQISPAFEWVFKQDYKTLEQLNLGLLVIIYGLFGFECDLTLESKLEINCDQPPTEQIIEICRKTNCYTDLSGTGAEDYLNKETLEANGIKLLWSDYEPFRYINEPFTYIKPQNLSVFDYLMVKGAAIPDAWKRKKEELLCQN